jgi:acid phosphatase
MIARAGLMLAAVVAIASRAADAQVDHRDIKWIRDSGEYQALTRQIYRHAAEAVARALAMTATDTVWAVVLDIDETVLETAVYQLEAAAYDRPFDTTTWNDWVRRERAVPVPGVERFLETVRARGARVAFISNRLESVREATRRNLAAFGLWQEGDRICLEVSGNAGYTKRARREELRRGTGRCAWEGEPVHIHAYLGDALSDFPAEGEEDGGFGERWFVLPNPSYGSWERRVTRRED